MGTPLGRRGSLKRVRNSKPRHDTGHEAADVRHVRHAATGLLGDGEAADELEDRPQADGQIAGTCIGKRSMSTVTRFVGNMTRYAPSTPEMAPEAPSVGITEPVSTRICAKLAMRPAIT